MQTEAGGKKYKALSSTVIYGANAAGKTNIIGAMDTFKEIVLRGHIRNDERTLTPNHAAGTLELIPNLASDAPVAFSVAFVTKGHFISYAFKADLGQFLITDSKRKIVEEKLTIDGEMIFTRKNDLKMGKRAEFFVDDIDAAIKLLRKNLKEDELFLMNGFKSLVSATIVSLVTDWLCDYFLVVYRADALHIINRREPAFDINEIFEYLSSGTSRLRHIRERESYELKLFSYFEKQKKVLPAEVFESHGTMRFLKMVFPVVAETLTKGGILVVDEFDASIHPMVIMDITNIFHNEFVNVNKAQLIFNTHNPIFLNANLFRRDEIKFVERDEETNNSELYALSEFEGVCITDDYLKNYFAFRYGAIRHTDFSTPLEKLIGEMV